MKYHQKWFDQSIDNQKNKNNGTVLCIQYAITSMSWWTKGIMFEMNVEIIKY